MASAESHLFLGHPDAMWMHDPETLCILAVNDSACALYGYLREEFLTLTVDELRVSDDAPGPPDPEDPLDSPLPGPRRELHRTKHGTRLAVELRAAEVDHQARRVTLVTVRDVSSLAELERDRQALRERLSAREGRYRLATRLLQTLEGISDGLFTINRHTRFTFVNHEAERLLRRGADEILGERLFDVLPEAEGSSFERRCREAMTTGRSVSFDEYFAPLDRWFDVRAYPTPGELVVYFHDVSAERVQQARLRLLEVAVDRLNDMVMITEAQPIEEPGPRIIYVNQAFERSTGYSLDEVVGRSPRLLQGAGTDRRQLDRIRQALAAGEGVRSELVNYTRSGLQFRVEVDIAPIIDADGRLTHWVSVQRDVTEQRELEEKLRRSQRLDAVGQLTGGVAHDFNNLLTVILGNADLLAEELVADHRLHTLALMSRTAAERGAELTRRLLAFARRQNLDPNITNVDELLGSMYGLLCRSLGEHVEIALSQGKGLWEAMVDASQLESAVLNLCLNARDAMPDGGRLTLATENVHLEEGDHIHEGEVTPGEYVTITVADTGTGMPEDIVEHAFEPFFTTKETGKGSGLGLSMVYGFIKQSSGHIRIRSQPGQGTSVVLYLPRAPRPAVQESAPSRDTDMVGGSERILLVEDDDIVRSFVAAELEDLGYEVTSVGDGPRAMEALRSAGPFDLLFTDMIMPGGMNGRELAEAALALRPELPVLFTSGYTEDAILQQSHLARGGEPLPLLHKPYRRTELAAKVRQVLARRPS